jgi:hypothetical protein
MKIENEDGNIIVTLEKDDTLKLQTLNGLDVVNVESDGNKLDIIGGSNIINSIKGNGMIEKVVVPPVVYASEIIEKCDKWLDMFRKIHDKFKELALSKEYRDENLVMELVFSNFTYLEDTTVRGASIDIDIKLFDTIVQEGLTISVCDENEDVYAYLVANVIDYYVSNNYKGTQIKFMNYNGILYSNEKKDNKSLVPMLANTCNLRENARLNKVVNSVLEAHNLNISTDQIINNLRDKITNQPINNKFYESIEHSETQFNYYFGKDPVRTNSNKN